MSALHPDDVVKVQVFVNKVFEIHRDLLSYSVVTFFSNKSIDGFMVTRSLEKQRSTQRTARRLLRIQPVVICQETAPILPFSTYIDKISISHV
jgi:hypothetical protein